MFCQLISGAVGAILSYWLLSWREGLETKLCNLVGTVIVFDRGVLSQSTMTFLTGVIELFFYSPLKSHYWSLWNAIHNWKDFSRVALWFFKNGYEFLQLALGQRFKYNIQVI